MKKNKKINFFQSTPVTAAFGTVAVIAGLFFLGQGSITGNTILKDNIPNTSLALSIIGLLLIVCSIILLAYSVKKK